jgi:hypothetical protein
METFKLKEFSLLAFVFGFAFCFTAAALAQPATTVVGFDGGSNGEFQGNAFFEATMGNPGGNAHFLLKTFGIELRTGSPGGPSNSNFLGDYQASGLVTVGVDVQVNTINFFGTEVGRNLGFVFVDHDVVGPGGPAGLWFGLGEISANATSNWTHFELTIDDFPVVLPQGWIGFGDEDPMTFTPILPVGATFASVLSGVDEFRISTFEPGFFYGFTNFDVRVDNVSITVGSSVPEPGFSVLLFASVFGLAFGRPSRKFKVKGK